MSSDGGVEKKAWGCTGCCTAMSLGVDRVQDKCDYQMERCGLNYRKRLMVWHFLDQLKEQVLAVLPISFLLIFVIGAFFQQTITSPDQTAYGLVSAIFGLLFFMEGLRIVVMPLGEMVGRRLPMKYPLWVVLVVAGFLGILVTYAEPAISSLTPLAKLVDKTKAPYLYYALNDQREMLVLSIGLGVGMAAVVGTLRFVRGWSLKPIIYITLVPTIGIACYMQWGNPDLAPLLGLAWDCGAVTTGPVTVPILLAMGIGVMGSQRQKRLAKAALQNAVDTNTGQTLEGFGVVTLASLFPVLAVEIMGCMIGATKTKEDIILNSKDSSSTAAVDLSPTREVIFAIRAIMPLICALLLIVVFLIREPIPHMTAYTVGPSVSGPEDSAHGSVADSATGGTSQQQHAGQSHGARPPSLGKDSRSGLAKAGSDGLGSKDISGESLPLTIATTLTEAGPSATLRGNGGSGSGSDAGRPPALAPAPVPAPSLAPAAITATSAGPVAEGTETIVELPATVLNSRPPQPILAHVGIPEVDVHSVSVSMDPTSAGPHGGSGLEDPIELLHAQEKKGVQQRRKGDGGDEPRPPTPHPRKGGGGGVAEEDVEAAAIRMEVDGKPVQERWIVRYGGLITGICMAQGGMIAFNIGLTYGFTALGDQAGSLLPAAYLSVPNYPDSPYYSLVGGIILVLVVAFALGFLATRAEPALRVLGRTVQHLSNGAFTANMLIYAVSVGVGCGMSVGSTKILFGVPLIYIILAKYAVAIAITIFSEEDFTNIAWDSAGVTTGPVTVPFVLSLGIGFSKATGATEGFGILTAASVSPIISVLLTNLMKKPAKAVARSISRLSARRKGSLTRSSLAAMSERAKRHKDTNGAIDSVAAIVAAAAQLETRSQWANATASASGLGTPQQSLAMGSMELYTQQSSVASGALSPRDGGSVVAPSRLGPGGAVAGSTSLASASSRPKSGMDRPSVKFADAAAASAVAAAETEAGAVPGAEPAAPKPPAPQ